jgi:hypothetical protein
VEARLLLELGVHAPAIVGVGGDVYVVAGADPGEVGEAVEIKAEAGGLIVGNQPTDIFSGCVIHHDTPWKEDLGTLYHNAGEKSRAFVIFARRQGGFLIVFDLFSVCFQKIHSFSAFSPRFVTHL